MSSALSKPTHQSAVRAIRDLKKNILNIPAVGSILLIGKAQRKRNGLTSALMLVRCNSVTQARHLGDDIAGVACSREMDAGGDTQGGKEHQDQWAVGGGLQDGEP